MNANRVFLIDKFPVVKCSNLIIPGEHPEQPMPVKPDIYNLGSGDSSRIVFSISETEEPLSIISLETVDRGDPYITEGILRNAVHEVRRQAVGTGEMCKRIL